MPAENKNDTREILLRISPTRNTLTVEVQKPGGTVAYKEISPTELYFAINNSYTSRDLLSSGFLPENCLHVSMNSMERHFILWNPELNPYVVLPLLQRLFRWKGVLREQHSAPV